MNAVLSQPFVWLMISVAAFLLCILLPIKIQNNAVRKWVMWFVLIPVSLVIIFYVYPMGLEIFRRFSIGF